MVDKFHWEFLPTSLHEKEKGSRNLLHWDNNDMKGENLMGRDQTLGKLLLKCLINNSKLHVIYFDSTRSWNLSRHYTTDL